MEADSVFPLLSAAAPDAEEENISFQYAFCFPGDRRHLHADCFFIGISCEQERATQKPLSLQKKKKEALDNCFLWDIINYVIILLI